MVSIMIADDSAATRQILKNIIATTGHNLVAEAKDGLETIEKIKEHGYSLNPGRYVGIAAKEGEDFDFYERLEELNEELQQLNLEAKELEDMISHNIIQIMEAKND